MKLLIINESHVVFKTFTRLLEALELCPPSTCSNVAAILKEKEQYCFIKVLLVRWLICLNQHFLIYSTPPLWLKTLKSAWAGRAGEHGIQSLYHVHCDAATADFLSSPQISSALSLCWIFIWWAPGYLLWPSSQTSLPSLSYIFQLL